MLLEDASPAEIPPLLRRPPWQHDEPPLLPIIEGLALLPFEPRKGMSDEERARYAKPQRSLSDLRGFNLVPKHLEPQTPEMDAFVVARLQKPTRYGVSYLDLLTEPAARAYLEQHGLAHLFAEYDEEEHVIAHFGEMAVDALSRKTSTLRYVASIDYAMREIERALPQLEIDPQHEIPAYLSRFPEVAAIILLPMALSGKDRKGVVTLLQQLSRKRPAIVQEVARRYGPAVEGALPDLLAYPVVPRKPPILPDWADPGVLPSIALAAAPGKRLPEGAARHFTRLLAMRPGREWPEAEAWLDEVSGAFTRESLVAFVLGLFQAWIAAGTPPSGDFTMRALAWLHDDAAARELAASMRVWAGKKSERSRVSEGLIWLRTMKTNVALAYIDEIARRAEDIDIRIGAMNTLKDLVELRDLTPDERSDRVAPTFGLDSGGSLLLSFGPRSFRVELDERLSPMVLLDDGRRSADLPTPAKGDDPALAAAAVRSWKALNDDARALVGHHLLRMETAMVTGRRWTSRELLDRIVGHPFLVHFARRLVWAVFSGDRPEATFHAAEDRSLTGPDDAPFSLPEGASVGLVHPADLESSELSRWKTLFASHGIVQPFPQLERDVHVVTEAEADATSLTRFEGKVVPAAALAGLVSRGWTDQSSGDDIVALHRTIQGFVAVLPFKHGYRQSSPSDSEPQTLSALTVRRPRGPITRLGAIPRMVFSELVHDLTSLVAPVRKARRGRTRG